MNHSVAQGTESPDLPIEICGYLVDSELSKQKSFLVIGPGGRGVVLKKIDDDCLLGGLLHPSIRERLCRIRELAHGGLANLHGVGREGPGAYLIWEYVPGRTFDQYVAGDDRGSREILLACRELVLTVDSLHAQGIVHGAISQANVIVTSEGAVRLTHASPLLYGDPAVDAEAVIALLERAAEARGREDPRLGLMLAVAARQQIGLRSLAVKLAALLDSTGGQSRPPLPPDERRLRRRMLLGVALVCLLGLALGYCVWRIIKL